MQDVRNQFPLADQPVPVLTSEGWQSGKMVYLDNGASTPMALFLQEESSRLYQTTYSNVHRGAHYASKVISELFEEAREQVVDFLKGNHETHEVIFGQNTTDVLNLAAHVTGHLDGVVLTTDLEHHSNYLPFLRYGEVDLVQPRENGEVDLADLEQKLQKQRVKLVAVTGCSNVTGVMPDLHKISRLAHEHGALLLVDGAQLLAHGPVDVTAMGIDMLVSAGHKFYSPGSAFLYAPRDIMNQATPYKPGGGTVNYVIDNDRIGFRQVPDRHEGGTPHIVGAILMGKALAWLKDIGMDEVRTHELELLKYVYPKLTAIEGVTVYGPEDLESRAGVLSFNVEGVNHGLVAAILNYEAGVAVRNGCHCAHRYLTKLLDIPSESFDEIAQVTEQRECSTISQEQYESIPGTARAVIGIFTNTEDMDILVETVQKIANREWVGTYEYVNGEYLPKEWNDIDLSEWPHLSPLSHS